MINQIKSASHSIEETKKGLNKDKAYSQPFLGSVSINPNYSSKVGASGVDLHVLLKRYSTHPILNAIINVRANQVSMYSQPVKYSEKGQGFKVRLKDINEKPNRDEKAKIREIEQFLMNTGRDTDVTRDSFDTFLRKIVRDSLVYDQVNFEKVFDTNKNLAYFKVVDPSTIYFATDGKGNIPKNGKYRYVQIMDGVERAKFTKDEMSFATRHPRSDIYSMGYGLSELEVTLHNFVSETNTEVFNDRFFSNGGTTRGVLLLKTGGNQSNQALDAFRREWKNSLSGMSGSWQIPVVNAEDVKFVNMTPTARDMEFSSWLNWNINIICANYTIDPGEIGFANRGGGATGSGGTSGLSDSNSSKQNQASQNNGLLPLLKFIEDTINKNIISVFGDKYYFQFVGGDVSTETAQLQILTDKVKTAMTVNEMREELGIDGDIIGGDIPLNGVIVQRIGQQMQEEQFEYQKQQDNINRYLGDQVERSSSHVSFQDLQQGLAGNATNVNGSDTTGNVGKDGQMKDKENTNSTGQGSTSEDD